MRVFIVCCHPEPQSFNAAMFRAACATITSAGHEVRTSDLYAMRFDPVSDRRNFNTVAEPSCFGQQAEELYACEHNGFTATIEAEITKLEWCDLLIWQFPLWWFGLPATLKGWVDRVFVMGRVYGRGQTYEKGRFRGKRALLSVTTGAPEESFRSGGRHGDIAGMLRPIQRGILQFTGFQVLAPQIVYAPAGMSLDQRQRQIETYVERLQRVFDETQIDVGAY